ncbi:hypothetical protein MMC30_001569 [Trapelia coarctata]|nr:hypothetical protein [Trapelia coarctata]
MGSRYLIGNRCIATITYDFAEKIELPDRRRENQANRFEMRRQRVLQRRKQDREKEAIVTFAGLFLSLVLCPVGVYFLSSSILVLCAVQYIQLQITRALRPRIVTLREGSQEDLLRQERRPHENAVIDSVALLWPVVLSVLFRFLSPWFAGLLAVFLAFLVSHGIVSAHKHEKLQVCDFFQSRQRGL